MPISSTNSKDIVANSVSLINQKNAVNNVDRVGQINDTSNLVGIPPYPLNTLEKTNNNNNDSRLYISNTNWINSKLPTNSMTNYYKRS